MGADILNDNYVYWMEAKDGKDSDIVISSRVRLARNLNKLPFPHLLSAEQGEQLIKIFKEAWRKSPDQGMHKMTLLTFDQLSNLDRQILMEKHLISPNHAKNNTSYSGVLVNDEGSLAIMINEEDHFRIQCFLPGLQLSESLDRAQQIDDALEAELSLAFDERRGYLTACPTNTGTGMRASVMLHLAAFVISGQLNYLFQNISQLGMTVRGLYGEGTEVIGNLFQLSNQITMGQTEEDIRSKLGSITEQIVEQERMMRRKLEADMKYQLEDRVGRAYGILTNARVINSNEAMNLLSDVRLGVDLGIIKDINAFALNELLVAIRPAHLQRKVGAEMEAYERDIKRAEVIKEKLIKQKKN
ncbi:MAG TPA: protein arginine kinase [Syntrophomonadaceae bacterium]|nr:protein arginine kinase [Syntrophomonadaceae bacterium]HNX28107.1 protein arginine kinase [Syntrophomonadaceae bacterium]HPR93490.1 protein arginine kinase [Syntrophomonadaceae bacterium]